MALHHPGAALLALSILLLGIFGFLQASETSPIPVDQFTVEQAYLEVHLIGQQLHRSKPPNITAEQRAILDSMLNLTTVLHFYKPNDPLPSPLHQPMIAFRQTFTNWGQPYKQVELMLTRGLTLYNLYNNMVKEVYRTLEAKGGADQHQKKAFTRAKEAVNELRNVGWQIMTKNNRKIKVERYDQNRLEGYIKAARVAVMAMPRIDVDISSFSSTLQPDKSQDEADGGGKDSAVPVEYSGGDPSGPDAGVPPSGSSSAGQVEDSTVGGGSEDPTEPELSTIPMDQLTVEQAYLEVALIKEQLLSSNPPSMTAKQKAIFYRLRASPDFRYSKPNDPLPSTLRQQMTDFRQAFTNWKQPLKPETVDYKISRGWALYLLYKGMLDTADDVMSEGGKYEGDKETMPRAGDAMDTLREVYLEVLKKFGKSGSLAAEDVKKLEKAIKAARNAVMATPRVEPLPSESAKGSPPLKPASDLPSGSSPRKPRNNLLHILTRPYVWGPAAFVTLGAVAATYYFLNGGSVSIFGHNYTRANATDGFDVSLVATGASSSHLGYFIFGGLVVALMALGYWWWYCNKSGAVAPPEDHQTGGGAATPEGKAKTADKVVSKRALKSKSKQLALSPTTTTSTPSSVKSISKKSQQLPATAGTSPSSAAKTTSARS